MKLSFITPHLPPRQTIWKTIECLNNQTVDSWEHIVMVDSPDYRIQDDHPNRKIINCPEWHHDFGNTCRHNAWDHVTGDYILYTDDDDLVYPECVEYLINSINTEPQFDWGMFPIKRLGATFFNPPPRGGLITGQQFYHKPIINGEEIRWCQGQVYCADWELVARCLLYLPYAVFGNLPPLAEIYKYNHGEIFE